MARHLLDDFHEKKEKLRMLAAKAKEFGWIDENREKDIVTKLDADVLTIGVIGQMKCGKSTFLNAFVFEDDVLPQAATPMTASLSVITFGEQAKVVVEFYTKDEWLEQCELASRSMEGLSEYDASRIKAAKQLVARSLPIKDSIDDYLGKSKEDSLDNIIDYVGAEGKFVSITKLVRVYYPKEYLKGVEIVDTPGFNDPIVSRELRTHEFLGKADVVIMMLSAGRLFDETDKTILFENVKQCGIGKVIIGINKYDVFYQEGERVERVRKYFVEKLYNQLRDSRNEIMLEILKDVDPIFLSAEMALLSELPMEKISQSDIYTHALHRYDTKLGISGKQRLREMSHMDDLANAIKVMIEQDKYEVLLRKPINAILSAGSEKKDALITELTRKAAELKILSTPEDELEEKELRLTKAEQRLSRKIEGLGEDLEMAIEDNARRGRNNLKDAMDASCKNMFKVVDSVKVFESFEKIKPRLNRIAIEFEARTAKRLVEELADDIKRKLKIAVRDFFTEAEGIIVRDVPDIVDGRDFVKEVERKINLQIENESIFCPDASDEKKSKGVWGRIVDGTVIFAFGLIGLGTKKTIEIAFRGATHERRKQELLESINSVQRAFDARPLVDSILVGKDLIIKEIKKKFIDEMIKPLTEKIASCRASLSQREENILAAKEQLEVLTESRRILEEQIDEINSMKSCLEAS